MTFVPGRIDATLSRKSKENVRLVCLLYIVVEVPTSNMGIPQDEKETFMVKMSTVRVTTVNSMMMCFGYVCVVQ